MSLHGIILVVYVDETIFADLKEEDL